MQLYLYFLDQNTTKHTPRYKTIQVEEHDNIMAVPLTAATVLGLDR